MRITSLLFLCLTYFSSNAQEPFLSFEHNVNTLGKKATQLFSAVFPENNKLNFFTF